MTRYFITILAIVTLCICMMAFEKPAAADTHYVPGQHATIQAAIDAAANYDQIEVAPGMYYEAINFLCKAIRLYSSGGPDVTTINGNGAYHVVQCVSGEDTNAILEGFTITGGNANGSLPHDYLGGGMYNSSSSPTLNDCIFSENSAGSWGGGILNVVGSPIVTNCSFSGNAAGEGGGILNHDNSNPILMNCNFSGNSAFNGGGMRNNRCNPIVANCTFIGNSADFGGGIYNYDSSTPTITNCTCTGNSASTFGGGMTNLASSNPTITNCIIWANALEQIANEESTPTVTYSDIQGGYSGAGNINADPCFVSPQNQDYHLLWDSPCINAGDPCGIYSGLTDIDFQPRVMYGRVDIGADEVFPISEGGKTKGIPASAGMTDPKRMRLPLPKIHKQPNGGQKNGPY